MSEEWQVYSPEEATNDKENEWPREASPEYKGIHRHSRNTQSQMPLTGCEHLRGTAGVWFKAWWRKGLRHNRGLFVILTSRRKRGQLDHKRLMLLPTLFMFKLLTCSQSKCPSLWDGGNRLQDFRDWTNGGATSPSVYNSWNNDHPSLPGCRKLQWLREGSLCYVLCKYLHFIVHSLHENLWGWCWFYLHCTDEETKTLWRMLSHWAVWS